MPSGYLHASSVNNYQADSVVFTPTTELSNSTRITQAPQGSRVCRPRGSKKGPTSNTFFSAEILVGIIFWFFWPLHCLLCPVPQGVDLGTFGPQGLQTGTPGGGGDGNAFKFCWVTSAASSVRPTPFWPGFHATAGLKHGPPLAAAHRRGAGPVAGGGGAASGPSHTATHLGGGHTPITW